MSTPVISSPTQSPSVTSDTKWSSLSAFSEEWFYKPDMMAIRIILICIAAQFDPQSEPIWMFLNGPSGSGKTALGINPMMGLPNVISIDSLTSHTLISGYIGNDNAGLLKRHPHGTYLIPDFTTILSLREDSRREIASQLRRVFDGKLDRENGALTGAGWEGKITIIAAVTPVIERYWGFLRDMGDRFLQVRWPRHHGPAVANKYRKHQGREKFIKDGLRNRVEDFFTNPRMIFANIPDVSDSQGDQLAALSEITCYLRAQVNRESSGNREIRDVPQIEQTGRVGKGLPALVRYSAVISRRDHITEDDMAIAKRVAIDCMPHTRALIMSHMSATEATDAKDIITKTGINESTLIWNMAELEALGVIKIASSSYGTNYEMTSHIKEMWRLAFPQT